MEKLETYFGNNPIYAIISGTAGILSNFIDAINPIVQFMIGVGSLVVIGLTIEAKIKERKKT